MDSPILTAAPVAAIILLWYLHRTKREDMPPDWKESAYEKGRPVPSSIEPSKKDFLNHLAMIHIQRAYRLSDSRQLRAWLLVLFWFFAATSLCLPVTLSLYAIGIVQRNFIAQNLQQLFISFAFGVFGFLLAWPIFIIKSGKKHLFQADNAKDSIKDLLQRFPSLQQSITKLGDLPLPWWWTYSLLSKRWKWRARGAVIKSMIVPCSIVLAYFSLDGFFPNDIPQNHALDFKVIVFVLLYGFYLFAIYRWVQIQTAPWTGSDYQEEDTFALAVLKDDVKQYTNL